VRRGAIMLSPQAVKHETFAVIFLDAPDRRLAVKPMFCGTVTQTSVYPRDGEGGAGRQCRSGDPGA
jgi:DNA repair protein RadC